MIIARVVHFLQRLVAAVQHVRTGGATTRTQARVRAAAPPRRCPTCHQTVSHSPDYRDHMH